MRKTILPMMLLLLVLLMSSCAVKNVGVKETEFETTSQEYIKDTISNDDEKFFKTDCETYKIETSYATLEYPLKWRDSVTVSVAEEGSCCSVSFEALLEGKSIDLFTVVIAEEIRGDLIGYIKSDKRKLNVSVISQYDEMIDILSNDSQTKYYNMCEDINVIISKLVHDCGMVIP